MRLWDATVVGTGHADCAAAYDLAAARRARFLIGANGVHSRVRQLTTWCRLILGRLPPEARAPLRAPPPNASEHTSSLISLAVRPCQTCGARKKLVRLTSPRENLTFERDAR